MSPRSIFVLDIKSSLAVLCPAMAAILAALPESKSCSFTYGPWKSSRKVSPANAQQATYVLGSKACPAQSITHVHQVAHEARRPG